MGQAQGPESQVGGSVGDATQTVLYGVDGLVNSHVSKIKLWWKRQPLISKSQHIDSMDLGLFHLRSALWHIITHMFLKIWLQPISAVCL